MRQRFALPAVVDVFLYVLVVCVDGHEDLLLDLDLLDDGDRHVLNDVHWHVLHDGHLLDDRHFLNHRDVDRVVDLLHVVVVDGVHLVRHVDGDVFAATKKSFSNGLAGSTVC